MPALATIERATAAERESQANLRNNLQKLRQNQPATAELIEQTESNLRWVYARDGSLTARHLDGRWWADCSVPLMAGRALLKTLEPVQTGSCLLAPAHAGLVRAARQRMGTAPVLFVVLNDVETARAILSCHDFSNEISSHRFWIACGTNWTDQLEAVFADHPGLTIPMRFIRTKLTADDVTTPLISAAQHVFSTALADRANHLAALQAEPVPAVDAGQILLISGSEFRLWEQGPQVIQDQLLANQSGDIRVNLFDTDDAKCGSPLALLRAARACGSVVSVNLCRADCHHLISTEMPWITWVTQPAVPAFESAGLRDALVLADCNWRGLARKANWPDDRVHVCGWPMHDDRHQIGQSNQELAFICDTQPVEIPPGVSDFSSHKLLWELIEEELATDPLTVEKVDAYLADRAGQLNIAADALDRRNFINALIIPAYQQGLARLLVAEGLPIAIWGRGWDQIAEFSANHRGNISTAERLDEAVAAAAGLVYCWPARSAHPIDARGKRVLHRSGRDRRQLIRNARRLLADGDAKSADGNQRLGQVILEILGVLK